MSKSAGWYRRVYQDISGSVTLSTSGDTQDLVADKANETIFIQSYRIVITGASAGKTWTLKDKAGTPILVSPDVSTTTASEAHSELDARGMALTQGKGLQLVCSATGAAGHVEWTGYRKLTAVAGP